MSALPRCLELEEAYHNSMIEADAFFFNEIGVVMLTAMEEQDKIAAKAWKKERLARIFVFLHKKKTKRFLLKVFTAWEMEKFK